MGDLLKIAMTKAAAPVGVEDLRELMGPIRRLYNQLLDKEADTSKKNVLKVIGGLIDAIDKEEVYKLLADIIREIQGFVIFKKPMPMLTGVPGPYPTKKSLCLSYSAHSVAEENGRREARVSLEPPTVWTTKASTVYKAEFCQLTNRWFWTSVAKCSCARDSCPRKRKELTPVEVQDGWRGGKGNGGKVGARDHLINFLGCNKTGLGLDTNLKPGEIFDQILNTLYCSFQLKKIYMTQIDFCKTTKM